MSPILLFVLAAIGAGLFFWPRHGLVARWRLGLRARTRIQIEDALKYIYDGEVEGRRPTLAGIAGRLQIPEHQAAALLQRMQQQQLVRLDSNEIRLKPAARAQALHLVRAHRLWERHLADETGYAEDQWHARAEQAEHKLTPEETRALAQRLNYPLIDPHGDPIPTPEGEVRAARGQPLTSVADGEAGRILHIEDEPESRYAQLVADGFYPGMMIHLLERRDAQLRVWGDGKEHLLPTVVANAINVEPVAKPSLLHPCATLADLAPNECGRISALSPRCRGAERSRFLDLGFVPGTEVTAELVSPGGDPTAYRVRDTLIALRKEQAAHIRLEPLTARAAHVNSADLEEVQA